MILFLHTKIVSVPCIQIETCCLNGYITQEPRISDTLSLVKSCICFNKHVKIHIHSSYYSKARVTKRRILLQAHILGEFDSCHAYDVEHF